MVKPRLLKLTYNLKPRKYVRDFTIKTQKTKVLKSIDAGKRILINRWAFIAY